MLQTDLCDPGRQRFWRVFRQIGTWVPILMLALGGCGGVSKRDIRLADVPGAEPRVEPKAKLGNMTSYEVFGKTYRPKSTSRGHVERGIASWYGPKFHGKKTSSGERYDMHQWTAAHKTLPLPTYALVTNLENGRSLIVKINDRGPFVGERIIDLSYAAAKALDVDKKGTAMVQVTSIDPRDHEGKVPKRLRVAGVTLAADDAVQGSGEDRPARADAEPKPKSRVASASSRAAASSYSGFTAAGAGVAARPAASPADHPSVRPAVAKSAAPLYLQVGAFGSRANAEQMRSRLSGQLAAPVNIADPAETSATSDGKRLFRVRIGPLGSPSDAERLAAELATLGLGPALVVPR